MSSLIALISLAYFSNAYTLQDQMNSHRTPDSPTFTYSTDKYMTFEKITFSDDSKNLVLYRTSDYRTNWRLCPTRCGKALGCVGYVVDMGNNHCWLKSEVVNVHPHNIFSSSFKTQAPRVYDYSRGYDMKGNDMTFYNGDISLCAQACDALPGCVAFVQNIDDMNILLPHGCWLKNKLGRSEPLYGNSLFTLKIDRPAPAPAPVTNPANAVSSGLEGTPNDAP